MQNKFGKIRPIQEYPVQDKKWIIKSVELAKSNLWNPAPIAIKSLDTIKNKFHTLSLEEVDKLLKRAEMFTKDKDKRYLQEIKDNVEEYKDGRPGEKWKAELEFQKESL